MGDGALDELEVRKNELETHEYLLNLADETPAETDAAKEPAETAAETPAKGDGEKAADPAKPAGTNVGLIIGIVAAVVVVGGGIGVYCCMKGKKEEPEGGASDKQLFK